MAYGGSGGIAAVCALVETSQRGDRCNYLKESATQSLFLSIKLNAHLAFINITLGNDDRDFVANFDTRIGFVGRK